MHKYIPAVCLLLFGCGSTEPEKVKEEPEYFPRVVYAITDERGITYHWHDGITILYPTDITLIPDWITND